VAISATFVAATFTSYAGNKDRAGQAGASELLINPWTRTSGWGGANMAKLSGAEALWGNVAGAAYKPSTQVAFAYTDWLKGTGTKVMALGFTTKVGDAGALGIQVMSMNFGEIEITTTDSPDGGVGTFKPSLLNVALSYSKAFSNNIYAGFLIKGVSESISDVNAFGIALDVGIQYVTGENDQLAFGISLKNVGPKMKFSGDGLSLKAFIPGQESSFTIEQRSMAFEIPAQLNIGAAYDFLMKNEMKFTLAGNYTSNSFTQDQFSLGLEYNFKDILMLRGGYTYENGIWDDANTYENTNVSNGLSAGVSVALPINKETGSFIGIDYAFRQTISFNNNHTIGIIFNF
jgi:hypothetical protein